MAEIASRLREIQEDLADASEDVRRRHLSDEVRRALEKLLPHQRTEFLESLSELFPVWGEPMPNGVAAARPAGPPTDDPIALIAHVEEVAGSFDEEQRKAIGERLISAASSLGASVKGGGVSEESMERLRHALHLKQKPLDLDRAVDLLAALAGVADRLDAFAWTTYREIAPRQAPPATGEFRATIAKYIAGDPNVPAEKAKERLERLQKLLGALLNALSRTPGFADAYHENFEPDRIEHATRAGRTALAALKEGLSSACWQHYRTLHDKLDRPGEEMRQRIIECIQKIDQTARGRR